jgi:hypothetical protein
MNSRRMSVDTNNEQQYYQVDDKFQVHELMLRDRPRVTAYYDAIMNNKHLFENKVFIYICLHLIKCISIRLFLMLVLEQEY